MCVGWGGGEQKHQRTLSEIVGGETGSPLIGTLSTYYFAGLLTTTKFSTWLCYCLAVGNLGEFFLGIIPSGREV